MIGISLKCLDLFVIFAKVFGLFVFPVLTLLRFWTDYASLPTLSRDCISVAYFDRLFHDTFGSSGGTRTHNPLRAGVFKTPAYAIPPRCHAFAAILVRDEGLEPPTRRFKAC